MSAFELQEPTEWAGPPVLWSSSTLDDVGACPRRWQLLRSRWGEHDRFPVPASPAAMEGQVVHDALDRLTRACGQRGNPPFGSADFALALEAASFFPGFQESVTACERRLAASPGPRLRLRATSDELANRAIRMFREQYKSDPQETPSGGARATEVEVEPGTHVSERKALSEVKLRHPSLPFLGILDRVQLAADGVEIVDFKTGKPNEKHRRQLLRYALLWWRVRGERPIRTIAQYLNGAETWVVTERELLLAEDDISASVAQLARDAGSRPARARPGPDCRGCPVRARCTAGWQLRPEETEDGVGDAEVAATMPAGDHGFLARSIDGRPVAVVYERSLRDLLPPLRVDARGDPQKSGPRPDGALCVAS